MTSSQVFETLKMLIGDWQVTHDHGRISTVNYEMRCNNSVIVETWALKPGIDSLTLYHMDGDDFIATHYCPLGNQPRLLFTGLEGGKYKFETQSVANLTDPARDHCRAFDFEIVGKDTVWRSEIYAEENIETTESGVFKRVLNCG